MVKSTKKSQKQKQKQKQRTKQGASKNPAGKSKKTQKNAHSKTERSRPEFRVQKIELTQMQKVEIWTWIIFSAFYAVFVGALEFIVRDRFQEPREFLGFQVIWGESIRFFALAVWGLISLFWSLRFRRSF